MIIEDYVSFETAKLLKEKGFNGLCTAYYDCFTTENFHCGNEPTDFNSIDTKIRNIVAAPTLQMTMKWLREIYNLHILSVPYPHEDGVFYWSYKIAFLDSDTLAVMVTKKAAGFDTYEQACEAAIKYCLENLIERYNEDKQKDKVNEPFVIVTNCKTEKYFYAKNFSISLKTRPCLDVRVTITPKDLNDIVPVIGKYSLFDCVTKKECIDENEKLHIEVFDENNIKQDEYFIYDVWLQSINYETNIITLCCNYVN